MDGCLLFLFVVLGILAELEAQLEECPRPSVAGICNSNCRPERCPDSQLCCRNACGGYTCNRRRTNVDTCPRPTGAAVCISNCRPERCPDGQLCCRNTCGGYSCTRMRNSNVPSWCPIGSPRIVCLVNPCRVDTCRRYPNARCINDNPCEPNCVGNFYLGFWRIPRWVCDQPRRSRDRGRGRGMGMGPPA